MRILGVDLDRQPAAGRQEEHTLVLLDADGRVERVETLGTLPSVAAAVDRLVGDEPFLLGVDVPVVVPSKAAKARPVENLLRRRFGHRLPPGGRTSLAAGPLGVAGEALIAGLATAGRPCLPYPDRDRRQSGLAETYPGLVVKALLWESSFLAAGDAAAREGDGDALFRAFASPAYRAADLPARTGWLEQLAALDLVLRALEGNGGFDLEAVRAALRRAESAADTERAAALLDAALIAGTARRYLESPETSLFLGDREGGYVIVPADALIRRLATNDSRPPHRELFPRTSLRERLGSVARIRTPDLLSVPGRPDTVEASFDVVPLYEFDNLDEMMWWKHCRHLSGPSLPTEGLRELSVVLADASVEESAGEPLRLVRSRHRTLSFRFEPPVRWRRRIRTRDGRTYPFRVLRAVYETLSRSD